MKRKCTFILLLIKLATFTRFELRPQTWKVGKVFQEATYFDLAHLHPFCLPGLFFLSPSFLPKTGACLWLMFFAMKVLYNYLTEDPIFSSSNHQHSCVENKDAVSSWGWGGLESFQGEREIFSLTPHIGLPLRNGSPVAGTSLRQRKGWGGCEMIQHTAGTPCLLFQQRACSAVAMRSIQLGCESINLCSHRPHKL